MNPTADTPARLLVGRQLAAYRQQAGLSVRGLAAICGVDGASISKIEKGKYNASMDVLARILQPLGLEITLTKTDSAAHVSEG